MPQPTVLELLSRPTASGYPGKLTPEDLARIAGYLKRIGESDVCIGYASEAPKVSGHPIEYPYCSNCGGRAIDCKLVDPNNPPHHVCGLEFVLPAGVVPPNAKLVSSESDTVKPSPAVKPSPVSEILWKPVK